MQLKDAMKLVYESSWTAGLTPTGVGMDWRPTMVVTQNGLVAVDVGGEDTENTSQTRSYFIFPRIGEKELISLH